MPTDPMRFWQDENQDSFDPPESGFITGLCVFVEKTSSKAPSLGPKITGLWDSAFVQHRGLASPRDFGVLDGLFLG